MYNGKEEKMWKKMDFGGNNSHRNDNSSRSSGIRTYSSFSANCTNPRGGEYLVGNRMFGDGLSHNTGITPQEEIYMTDREFIKAKVVIGIIGYGIAAFMFLKAFGVL